MLNSVIGIFLVWLGIMFFLVLLRFLVMAFVAVFASAIDVWTRHRVKVIDAEFKRDTES